MPIYKTKAIKKNGKSQYRVVVHYTNSLGQHKQKSKRIYGYDEAKELEKQLEDQLTESRASSKLTLNQLYDEYIAAKKNDVRKSSLLKTKSILKNHVLNEPIAKKRIDKITVSILQNWKNHLGEKDLKLSTKNNAIRELNTLLNYAVNLEYISKNPLKQLGKFKDAYMTAQTRIRYYTAEQFKAFISLAKENRKTLTDYACYVFFNIAFYTGMRKGEIYALRWSDLEGNIIHVTRSLSQKIKDDNGEYFEGPPKTETSVRDLKIPAVLISVLDEYKERLHAVYDFDSSMRVCGSRKPVSDTSVSNYNTKYGKLAGLPHITIHEYRHSHASVLCNANINIQVVSRRLGHADVKETWKTYAHLYPKSEDMAVDILDML